MSLSICEIDVPADCNRAVIAMLLLRSGNSSGGRSRAALSRWLLLAHRDRHRGAELEGEASMHSLADKGPALPSRTTH